MENIFEIKNLSIKKNEKFLLNNINWNIASGESWAILGENGAGKSTLMDCLYCYRNDYIGSIYFLSSQNRPLTKPKINFLSLSKNENVSFSKRNILSYSLSELMSNVAVSYQELELEASLTVEDYLNISFFEKSIQIKILEFCEMQNKEKDSLSILSGGEKRKLSIASVLYSHKNILLFDEPTSYLDRRAISKFKKKVSSLNSSLVNNNNSNDIGSIKQQHKKTIIMVSHDINLSLDLCSHVLALKNGCIVYKGTKEKFQKNDLENLFGVKVEKISGRYLFK